MSPTPRIDDLTSNLSAATQTALDYLSTRDRGPAAHAKFPEAAAVPDGIGFAAALKWFREQYEPWLSASSGPRYLGFVTGGATPAGLAADWLIGAYDQNVSHRSGSIAAQIEEATARAYADLFGIGEEHRGHFVSGATASNLVALATARQWAGEKLGVDVSRHGMVGVSVRVIGGAPHASISKSLSILGLGRDALELVPCLPGRASIDTQAVVAALQRDKRPTVIVASAGEVNTGDFDNIAVLADIAHEHGAWLHVDGAFGLFAALDPARTPLLAGMSRADSITVDLHKWLNVPYDSALVYTRHPRTQRRVFDASAAYLGVEPEPFHYTPENSRRFRALAAWFTLAAYGRDGIADWVARNCAQAVALGERLSRIPGVELLSPVHLNIVCFAFAEPMQAYRDRVLDIVIESGEAFLTPTHVRGRPALRAAFVNWQTQDADVERVASAIEAAMKLAG